MGYVKQFVDVFLHLDIYLSNIIHQYGAMTYLILFVVIFCETGLVVIPFLPGDSLVFAAAAFAAKGDFNVIALFAILCAAAVLGDTVNYEIGHFIGPKIFEKESTRFFKKEHLIKTHNFYEKHGGKTIIFARFIPIIRTFAPFVAGIGGMSYLKFISYNFIGGISWVGLFTVAGYFFGNFPTVRKNFTLVIFAIIFISILPAVVTYLRQKYLSAKEES